ncbi:MAG TPA: hypothetical protein VGY48_15670 [Vicinamibacterales bacterium]|jgi:hypothetical protein|nr:hypothetical protein [Vicinamibacterales bacterium]
MANKFCVYWQGRKSSSAGLRKYGVFVRCYASAEAAAAAARTIAMRRGSSSVTDEHSSGFTKTLMTCRKSRCKSTSYGKSAGLAGGRRRIGLRGTDVGMAPRRVQIVAQGRIGAGYFKTGQYAYVVGSSDDGGMYWIDRPGHSARGETALLISKTKSGRGGALWISPAAVRFTARKRR